MNANYLAIFLPFILLVTVPRISAQGDDSVLADIHKRLDTPGIEARHDHDRMIFVGEIVQLGPVFQGVCKSAVAQTVDYRVTETLLGDVPQTTVRAGYANCTHAALPSPPFTLHSRVIVYCFTNMRIFRCLEPVPVTADRLKSVKSWVAQRSAEAAQPNTENQDKSANRKGGV